MPTPVVAYDAQVSIDGFDTQAHRWQVDHRIDAHDTTNFLAAGFGVTTVGVQECDITVEGFLNLDDDDGWSNISMGEEIPLVLSFETGEVAYTFPKAKVASYSHEADVRGVHRYTLLCHSTQSFTPSTVPSVENPTLP